MRTDERYDGAFIKGMQSLTPQDLPTALILNASSTPGDALALWLRFQNIRSEITPLMFASGKKVLGIQRHNTQKFFGRPLHRSTDSNHVIQSLCHSLGVFIQACIHLGLANNCIKVLMLPGNEVPSHGRFSLGFPVVASQTMPKILFNTSQMRMISRPKDSLARLQAEAEFFRLLDHHDIFHQDTGLTILDTLRRHPSANTICAVAQLLNTTPRRITHNITAQGSSFRQLLEHHQKSVLVQELQANQDGLQDIAGRLQFNSAEKLGLACRRWFHRTPESIRHRA